MNGTPSDFLHAIKKFPKNVRLYWLNWICSFSKKGKRHPFCRRQKKESPTPHLLFLQSKKRDPFNHFASRNGASFATSRMNVLRSRKIGIMKCQQWKFLITFSKTKFLNICFFREKTMPFFHFVKK